MAVVITMVAMLLTAALTYGVLSWLWPAKSAAPLAPPRGAGRTGRAAGPVDSSSSSSYDGGFIVPFDCHSADAGGGGDCGGGDSGGGGCD
jgi:hypothetical protein